MNEHYFRHNKSKLFKTEKDSASELARFKGALRAEDRAFGQIMDIANGTKHAHTRFFDLHYDKLGVSGVFRAGFPVSSANYVFVDEDNAWLLYRLTKHVAQAWKVKLGIV